MQNALTIQRLLVVLFLLLGLTLVTQPAYAHGDVHERIDALSQRIATPDPDTANVYLERSGLYRLDGDIDRALADIATATSINPALPQLDWFRAQLLHEAKLSRTALVSLNRFLRNQRNHLDARLLRARIHARLGNGQAAAADYGHAINQMEHPGPDCFLERANAIGAGPAPDVQTALQGLDEGIRSLGPIPSLQLRAIQLERKLGNVDAALARLQTLIDRSPHNANLIGQKGDILHEAGHVDRARAAYREALDRIESLPQSRRASRDSKTLQQSLQQRLSELKASP